MPNIQGYFSLFIGIIRCNLTLEFNGNIIEIIRDQCISHATGRVSLSLEETVTTSMKFTNCNYINIERLTNLTYFKEGTVKLRNC